MLYLFRGASAVNKAADDDIADQRVYRVKTVGEDHKKNIDRIDLSRDQKRKRGIAELKRHGAHEHKHGAEQRVSVRVCPLAAARKLSCDDCYHKHSEKQEQKLRKKSNC